MSVVQKIAYRNLREHKTKTLIVGSIITLGIAVLVIGNSMMDTAARGIRKTYVDSFTGHLIIAGTMQGGGLNLFGPENPNNFDAAIPAIPEYEAVEAFVSSHPAVAAINPQATSAAIIDWGEERTFLQVFGIDPERYRRMFPDNIEIVSGRMLAPGEEGILLAEQTAKELSRDAKRPIQAGDTVLLTGMSQLSGIRVREVPVRGIFRYRHSNPQLDWVSLLDITSLRALAGMNLAHVSTAELSELEASLFSGGLDEDALFGGGEDALFGGGVLEEVPVEEGLFGSSDVRSVDELFASLEGELARTMPQMEAADSPVWHFLLVRLKNDAEVAAVRADIQRFLAENEIDAQVLDWLRGAGPIASLAYGVKNLFNVVVLVIAVVAVIIIMNTLVISVTERITEIGTMRALGAQKSFIRRMIVWETVITSGLFGLLGVAIGCVVLGILNVTGIEAPNMFVEIIFGGKVLHPVPSWSSIVVSLVVVAAVGILASLYPTSIALKTKPVTAMQGS